MPIEIVMGLTANEVTFLAARLRRLFAHHGYQLPEFAKDDRSLIRIAGSAIGAVLTNATVGVQAPAPLPESMSRDEMLKYYSDYANMVCREVVAYQKRIRDLETALAAADVEGASKMNWQPIETAPKDGTEVILQKGTRVGAACWCKWPDTHDMDGALVHEGGEGWSIGFDGDEWEDPTHWQPLPTTHGAVVVRECCNAECGWKGETARMLGAVGPLCPDCGEVTEPATVGVTGTPKEQS